MNCKDCKYWKQHTYFTIKGIDVTKEKEFGKIFPIGILNYKSNYDKNTFEFIENKSNYGICKNEMTIGVHLDKALAVDYSGRVLVLLLCNFSTRKLL